MAGGTDGQERLRELESALCHSIDEQTEIYRRRQIAWMKDTRMAIVVSEEQGEVEKFRRWGVDIVPHRDLCYAHIFENYREAGSSVYDEDIA